MNILKPASRPSSRPPWTSDLFARRLPGRQRGVAIITAMLIVALGTITMVSIASRQQLSMQRERNEGVIQMARDLAASGERFAAALLYRDRKEALRENSDSLDDDWAQTIPPVPIDNAAIQGCIIDMQGRFNLNNLIDAEGRAAPNYVAQFARLLGTLNIDLTKVQAVVDWLDTDLEAQVPDGAEDDYYTGLDQPYRAANASFTSVSELQLVKGFGTLSEEEREDYALLVPHIAALPKSAEPSPVNVNTATPEVIKSLDDSYTAFGNDLSRWETSAYEDYPECEDIFDLSADDDGPETIETDRDLQPWTSVQRFIADAGGEAPSEGEPNPTGEQPPINSVTGLPREDPGGPGVGDGNVLMSVSSRYFEARIDVIAEGLRLSQFTLFERDDAGRTRIVRRARDTI